MRQMDNLLSSDIEAPPAKEPPVDARSQQAYTGFETGGSSRVHAGNAYYQNYTISKSARTYCVSAVTDY
jgi:hypothetical protein